MLNVLLFHRISTEPSEWMDVRLDVFKALLDAIVEKGLPTTTLQKWRPGSAYGICLTFDDGWASDYEIAFPMLQERGMKGVFFITTDWVGKPGYITWEQIREMHGAGMEIGSHTVTHPYLSAIDDSRVRKEFLDSKKSIEDHLGSNIQAISLPQGDFNGGTLKLAMAAGFQSIAKSEPGINRSRKETMYRNAFDMQFDKDQVDDAIQPMPFSLLKKRMWYHILYGLKKFIGIQRYLKSKDIIVRFLQPSSK